MYLLTLLLIVFFFSNFIATILDIKIWTILMIMNINSFFSTCSLDSKDFKKKYFFLQCEKFC